MRKKKRPVRIFIGLQEIAGYYTNLRQGLHALGTEVIFANLHRDRFQFTNSDDDPLLLKLIKYVGKRRERGQHFSFLIRVGLMIIYRLLKSLLFAWVLCVCDVFIFNFGTTFFRYKELPILKRLGKKVIYVFHGSDSRPPFIDGGFLAHEDQINYESLSALILQQRLKLQQIEQYADVMIAHPLSGHFHQKPFIIGLLIGIPFQSQWSPRKELPRTEVKPVRILHAPSDPAVKGTALIQQTIVNLKAKGYAIDYVEVRDQPHHIILQELQQCDFVIDQVYSDTPMAGFATEAAFFGKPAVVGGYGWQEIETFIEPTCLPPSQRCHPDELEGPIEQLIVDPAYRMTLGQKAQQFVMKVWNPREVAKRFLQVIEGNISPEWVYDPREIRYLYGVGLPAKRVQQIVHNIIQLYGTQGLQLSDKPELEHRFIELVRT